MPIRENVIETYFVKQFRKHLKGLALKLTSSNYRALPDRICMFPKRLGEPCSEVVFVELKAPGRQQTVKQKAVADKLRSLGYTVVVIDSRPRVDAFIEFYLKKQQASEGKGIDELRRNIQINRAAIKGKLGSVKGKVVAFKRKRPTSS